MFVALIAALWLRERITGARIAALIVGLCGVALLFHPSSAAASAAGLVGLASGALAGLALTTVKRLSSTEPPERIVAWFALLATLMSAAPALYGFVWPHKAEWLIIAGLGAFGTLGQITMTKAYERAPASRVSPLGYTSLIFA
ncbi:MAG: DMT family transporter, partial [Zetaproteobacteria bacterium]